jgi:hypothetical protein
MQILMLAALAWAGISATASPRQVCRIGEGAVVFILFSPCSHRCAKYTLSGSLAAGSAFLATPSARWGAPSGAFFSFSHVALSIPPGTLPALPARE